MIKGAAGEQLRMFMTAQELHGMESMEVHPTELAAWRTHDAMWADKKKDNDESWRQASYGDSETLSQSVAKRGVEYPVRLMHTAEGPKIDAGHHRIQGQYDADPGRYVPVTHKRART